MNAAVMGSPVSQTQSMSWGRLWRNAQAWAVTVALHGAVVALLVVGWTLQQPPVSAPSVLKTRLITLPAERAIAPAPQPLPVTQQPPVIEAKPEVKPVPVDPQIQARKLEQAALARKRVAEQQQALEARQVEQQQARLREQQADAQRQQALADQARVAADNARRAQEQAAAADVRHYLPISKEAPDYPQRALDKGIEGDCTVEYSVTPQGKVENPKVVGNCHPMFIRPSLLAAATFRYKPRMVDGQAVSVPSVRNTFHYKIQ
ncbi:MULTISPECIES: energy transducer TonB [unclassified Pseudomonas]|uniref:energy transducer TonB n=1 Tax=unclassified Pseudomonas TaxID=196821 RepID=UPI0014739FF3|nr:MULTISPECIES: energy transducer TonB [unclassified Pseudomonas]NMY36135.1 TonB family protein [Pseudomonas sp. WS 5078]NMY58876.1 TonB family protein [Pseudomonas sp. WS 5354]NMY76641.1 TonB family protein [Pseudomonas sp. WS 5071]